MEKLIKEERANREKSLAKIDETVSKNLEEVNETLKDYLKAKSEFKKKANDMIGNLQMGLDKLLTHEKS